MKLAFRAGINRLRVRSALHGGERLFVGIEDVDDDDQLDGGPLAGVPDVPVDVQIVLIAMGGRFEDFDYGRLWLRPSFAGKDGARLREEAGAAFAYTLQATIESNAELFRRIFVCDRALFV